MASTTTITIPNTTNMEDRDTARAKFTLVCDYLHGRRALDARLVSSTTRMLSTRLAMRDALIIAAVRPDVVDAETMATFAFEPHKPRTATLMGRLLTGAFETGEGYDAETLDRFDALIDAADGEPDAQCLAVRAYLAWWRRDTDNAMRLALEALTLFAPCGQGYSLLEMAIQLMQW